MMDDNHFLRPKQPLGNYQTAERFAGSAACVADDVCVAFGEAEDGEDVDARVHAGDDGQFAKLVSSMAAGEQSSRVRTAWEGEGDGLL